MAVPRPLPPDAERRTKGVDDMNKPLFQPLYAGITRKAFIVACAAPLLVGGHCSFADDEQTIVKSVDNDENDEVERAVNAYVHDPQYKDDPFILAAIKEALEGRRERNGGIGACIVREETGEIVERGHNEQYVPHFRSDLHAEMALLNRYEDRVRITRSFDAVNNSTSNPRVHMEGIVLYTSVEPYPMCMARIINSGIKKVYYASADDTGGMGHRMENLPPYWQGMAQGVLVEPARCSPLLKELAQKMFHPMKIPGT